MRYERKEVLVWLKANQKETVQEKEREQIEGVVAVKLPKRRVKVAIGESSIRR